MGGFSRWMGKRMHPKDEVVRITPSGTSGDVELTCRACRSQEYVTETYEENGWKCTSRTCKNCGKGKMIVKEKIDD